MGLCGLAMSGVEVPREQKQEHACASCMNMVVQSFNHFQEQIKTLRREKANLQERIKALDEENAELKKKSASPKNR
jgi:predicted nuclease with TOPRIM domain